MNAPDDEQPTVIDAVIRALLSEGRERGAELIETIAFPPRTIPKRPSVSRSLAGRIFRRDGFTCRYCGCQVIPTPIMQLLAGIYPESFPYHPNWKGGATHPAIPTRSAVVDHILPGAHGGHWLDDTNLATACWPCNVRKSDLTLEQLGWDLIEANANSSWDGLTTLYPPLWAAAGRPQPQLHMSWMRALGCDTNASRRHGHSVAPQAPGSLTEKTPIAGASNDGP
jgi:hypothetical protein